MLVKYISWKILKLSLLVSLVLAFSVFFTQLLRFVDVVSSLPIKESLLLVFAWFFYLFVYFFPNSLLLSLTYIFFELKENKKLLIIESFGIHKNKLILKVFAILLLAVFGCFLSGFFVDREDIQFLRRYGVYKYYSSLIASVPEKTFYKLPEMSIYLEERSGNKARDVFFNSRDMVIFAETVNFEQGKLVFEKGSVLHQQEGKSFVATFDQYILNLQKIVGLDKNQEKKDNIVHMVNFGMLFLYVPIASYLSLKVFYHTSSLYYFLAILSLVYQFTLILVRNLI